MQKDELIAAVRTVAAARGATALTLAEFHRATGINRKLVYDHFASWREMCAAAELAPAARCGKRTEGDIFAAMRDAFLACGGIASQPQFKRQFRYSVSLLEKRFGTWTHALVDFAAWVETEAPDFPYRDELAERVTERRVRPPPRRHAPASKTEPALNPARPCGDPLGYRGVLRAPINEMGVVLAFGAAADALGFGVEAVGAGFPDCAAKRRIADGRWLTVRIEFEYRSRNFRQHRHDPAGCDLIVCWEHDWPDCPLEVLELKSAIAGLRG